jgi:TetR/AcrR family transcriptional regulator, transcriptional repressor for nem operon
MPKAKETKAFIIEKTAPLFNTKGFVGTSLTDMEKATGLTKGSIYNNFSNKDEVALAVFDHNLKIVNTIIQAEMDKYDSAEDKLLSYVKVYSNNVLQSPFPIGGCPILNTAIEADDSHPSLRKKANAAVLAWKNKIISLINQGIKTKEFRRSVNANETALTIIATIEGGVMISKVTGNTTHMKTIMHAVEKMIHGLK